MKTLKDKTLIIAACLVLPLALSACGSKKDATPNATTTATTVTAQQVANSLTIKRELAYPGTVVSESEAVVVAKTAGTVSNFNVKAGDQVAMSQQLGQINDVSGSKSSPTAFNATQVKQAQIAVTQAQTAYQLALTNYNNLLVSSAKDIKAAEISRDQALKGQTNLNSTTAEALKSAQLAYDMGVEVSHQPIEWDGIITSLVTKKIDIIASGMSITPDHAKQVNFTNPYWVIKQVMVVKKGSPLTVENVLSGKKILGVQQGTSEAKWLKEQATAKGWNFELRYYNSSPLAVEDVLNGRIDAAAMDDAPAKDAAAKKDVQVLGTFGMDTEEFGYAVRKDDQALLDKVNASLKKLMASPDWAALIKKYELEK
jgi:polar amino acid transport system substrate-binding protein